MEALQSSSFLCSSSSSTSSQRHRRRAMETMTTLHVPSLSLPKLPTTNLVEELNMRGRYTAITTTTSTTHEKMMRRTHARDDELIAKLHAIMEAVADRVEMHANIGEQRNNWNNLLLTSINAITITAATMAGLASIGGIGAPILALKVSSTLLYSAATGMLLVMNKIQPSQLAEEQRNATRLFKKLHGEIQTTLALGTPTAMDVNDAMEKVLALDKAFPLPLLGGVMLDKFPKTVEPAVWWPLQQQRLQQSEGKLEKNGWSGKLEEEMREILGVMKRKDNAEYVKLSKLVLKVNKIFAISGPLLTGIAAFGSAFVGSPSQGSWAVLFGVVAGAMACVVNTLEHGGQVGMVFEMYRSCAGSFQLLQESIESTLKEKMVERRENGELFEMKVALQLGRSLSQLRNLAASSSSPTNADTSDEEFASKLY